MFASWVRRGQRFCSKACVDAAKIRTPADVFKHPYIRNADGCRLLVRPTGPKKGEVYDSYVDMVIAGEQGLAHRWAWEAINGRAVPDGMMIRHLCPGGGNPPCIEPMHLEPGTALENAADAIAWGRIATGSRNARYTHPETSPRGEGHGRARLTTEQVVFIRTHYIKRHPIYGLTPLARMFNVGATTVGHVVAGDTWQEYQPRATNAST